MAFVRCRAELDFCEYTAASSQRHESSPSHVSTPESVSKAVLCARFCTNYVVSLCGLFIQQTILGDWLKKTELLRRAHVESLDHDKDNNHKGHGDGKPAHCRNSQTSDAEALCDLWGETLAVIVYVL